ncbi:MAG: class I SAM-dependent methyltransferase [Cyanobacteria bacterium P01_A01_bin.123]
MRVYNALIGLVLSTCLFLGTTACSQSPGILSNLTHQFEGYTQKTASVDGIGKVYMGREIAQVMGHQGAYWLERPSRAGQENPDAAIAALNLSPDAIVADIGAGTGYMSFRVAAEVPGGQVFAVDVQPEMIEFIQQNKSEKAITNVEPILSTDQDPNLPAETIDLAIMVDAYHEFEYPHEMMQHIFAALKPGGRVVLAEYRAENPLVMIKRLHKMSQAQVKREMATVGLSWEKTDDRLPQQHLMFFVKREG